MTDSPPPHPPSFPAPAPWQGQETSGLSAKSISSFPSGSCPLLSISGVMKTKSLQAGGPSPSVLHPFTPSPLQTTGQGPRRLRQGGGHAAPAGAGRLRFAGGNPGPLGTGDSPAWRHLELEHYCSVMKICLLEYRRDACRPQTGKALAKERQRQALAALPSHTVTTIPAPGSHAAPACPRKHAQPRGQRTGGSDPPAFAPDPANSTWPPPSGRSAAVTGEPHRSANGQVTGSFAASLRPGCGGGVRLYKSLPP